MSNTMNEDQFSQLMNRLSQMESRFDHMESRLNYIEENMVKKSDLFQSVLTVQGFTFAIIIGVIVALNAIVGIA